MRAYVHVERTFEAELEQEKKGKHADMGGQIMMMELIAKKAIQLLFLQPQKIPNSQLFTQNK